MAKLIGMLVDAGLNKGFEWPDGFEYCVQDNDHQAYLVFGEGKFRHYNCWTTSYYCNVDGGTLTELADDYQTAQITKQEYLDAMEKAKKEVVRAAELGVPWLNNVVDMDVVLKLKESTPDMLWHLPTLLSEYSRKKESFSLLEKELNDKRGELYSLQEDIRLLCEQQGWKIEPLGL